VVRADFADGVFVRHSTGSKRLPAHEWSDEGIAHSHPGGMKSWQDRRMLLCERDSLSPSCTWLLPRSMAAESAKRFLVNATLYALKRIRLMNFGSHRSEAVVIPPNR
jgi:hypothetical protein